MLCAVVVLLGAGVLEGGSRLVHRDIWPVVPYMFRSDAAFLPSDADVLVGFAQRKPVRYVTDKGGARIADPAIRNMPFDGGILVLGDSQALGYMLDFEDTFAAQVARIITGDVRAARIVAAPANHPGVFASALRRYRSAVAGRPRVFVATVNLGNDLDELFDEEIAGERYAEAGVAEWLRLHSFIYMDMLVLRVNALRGETDLLGVNNILFTMAPDERIVLVGQASQRIAELMAAVDARYKFVVTIPSDYQVDTAQFDKYRLYYSDTDLFNKLRRNVPHYARMMQVLEDYLESRMPRGTVLISFSKLIQDDRDPASLFDDTSHHITARGHRIIAEAIAGRVGDDASSH